MSMEENVSYKSDHRDATSIIPQKEQLLLGTNEFEMKQHWLTKFVHIEFQLL